MNKKVVVMMVLAGVQNAHAAGWLEMLASLPIIRQVCATFIAKNTTNRPLSIMGRTSIIQKPLEKSIISTGSYKLNLTNILNGNLIIRTHKESKVIITPTAYGTNQQIANIDYETNIKDGELFIICHDNNSSPKIKRSWIPFLAFLQKNKTEVTRQPNDYGLHLEITVPQEYDIKTKTKGYATITNITGQLDLEINVGNVNINLWRLPQGGAATENKIKITGMGNIHTNVPDNTSITFEGTTNQITQQGKNYKGPTYIKGNKKHTLQISTFGKIDLDPVDQKK